MVDDIGLTKQWLTEEDIKIEQGWRKSSMQSDEIL
jgi:hypothetical protein